MIWKQFRGILMFGLGCILSPCCTPLLVPLGLSLLGGTPVAIWLSYRLGWVYGVLTLVSIASFILAIRWINSSKKHNSRPVDSKLVQHRSNVLDPDQLDLVHKSSQPDHLVQD